MKAVTSTCGYFALVMLVALATTAQAQIPLTPKSKVVFATAAEAKQILTTRDDFIERLSPFDRQARLKTDKAVTEQAFLEFIARNVRDWSDAEQQKVAAAINAVQPKLAGLNLPLPEKIFLLRTTGEEEGEAFYTRGAALVFPTARLADTDDAELQKVVCHELFHVLSRANPKLKEALYQTIGFTKCGEVELPAALKDRRITNPDAPRNDHYIRIRIEGQERAAVPILYSRTPAYDPRRGGGFFEYLEFRFLPIRLDNDGPRPDADVDGLAEPTAVAGFFEQIGRNTGYVIHPEEVLADNFAMLVLGSPKPTSPEIIAKIEQVLKEFTPDEESPAP